jgi:diacylglycerol O-acyltransferase / wax synthase
MTGRRPVGAVDTMWLNMDRPNNLMIIDSVMWFDETVDWDRLTTVLETRLVGRYPVFRQRPVQTFGGLGRQQWEDDPDFSLSRHLHRATLPPPGDEACLQRYVEAQMHKPFDRSHPLWEAHFVDGYLHGAAVVIRIHHAIADGIALAEVLLSLTDATPSADLEELADGTEMHGGRGLRGSILGIAAPVLRGAEQLLSALPGLARPSAVLDAITLAQQTGHVADKLLLRSNPPNVFGGRPGIEKRAVWSSPRRLADVKRVGRAADATVNDVLVGAVSGALSAYLMSHDGKATDLTTMVPVNVRPVGEPLPRELGNRFALVLLPLPTGVRSPLARLSETKRRMDSIKRSPEAMITFGLINAIGRTHPSIEALIVDFFSSKAIGVTTNVVGPMVDRFLAGSPIAGVLGWVPGSGRQTVGVCIFSYNQSVRVGFKVDAGVIQEPERLVEAFDQEMDDLLHIARAVRDRSGTCQPTPLVRRSRSTRRTTESWPSSGT